MKIYITLIALALSFNANATSLLVFKNVYKCETAQKVQGSEWLISVDEAQDGQSRIKWEADGDESIVVQTKKIIPPRMKAGAPLVYETRNSKDQQIRLAIGSTPFKLGRNTGKLSKLSAEGIFENVPMVCFRNEK
jgi:hypothetical protein